MVRLPFSVRKFSLAAKACSLCVALALTGAVKATGFPPYEFYEYLADATDNPPVNFMKVVEPGRSGEAKASYVVLGIASVRKYQAVDSTYEGRLVIPAYIDGLPVRKIDDAAFLECRKITDITIPSTVREIGARAFTDCVALTNITFESGVQRIGDYAFSNCLSLASIRLPKTLSSLGLRPFHGCIQLTDVYFEGNAPRLAVPAVTDLSPLGEALYMRYGYYERFKVHIDRETTGWIAPCVKGVPEKWPVDFGYKQAHETVAESGGDDSLPEAGFVVVVTEIKGGAVAVPETWAKRFPDYARQFGSDFGASLTRPTGKRDAAGQPLVVWQDYVAGTDPTDPRDTFRADIAFVGGRPVVTVRPALPEKERAKRKYTLWGKRRLSDEAWTVVPEGSETECNFFKVSVELR